MLDIKFIRENKDLVKEAARKKRIDFDIGALLQADDKRKALGQQVDDKNREKKLAAENRDIEAGRRVKEELEVLEAELKEAMKAWHLLMLQVPNVPDISVPEGESDADNKEV